LTWAPRNYQQLQMHIPAEDDLDDSELEFDSNFRFNDSFDLILEYTNSLNRVSSILRIPMTLDDLYNLKKTLEHLDHLSSTTEMLKLRSIYQSMSQRKAKMTLETRYTMLSKAIDQLGEHIRGWNTKHIKNSIEVNSEY
jgi:hypothetical protein